MSITGYNETETFGDLELELKGRLGIFPDELLLWMNLGNDLVDLGRFAESKDVFMHSIGLNLASINAYVFVNERLGRLNDVEFLMYEL